MRIRWAFPNLDFPPLGMDTVTALLYVRMLRSRAGECLERTRQMPDREQARLAQSAESGTKISYCILASEKTSRWFAGRIKIGCNINSYEIRKLYFLNRPESFSSKPNRVFSTFCVGVSEVRKPPRNLRFPTQWESFAEHTGNRIERLGL